MLDKVFYVMVAVSFLCAILTGRMAELTSAITDGAQSAVTLGISLLGTMCLWQGLLEVMASNGCGTAIRRILSPVISRLFRTKEKDMSKDAQEAVCACVAANVLGLGNAATPFGLAAAKLVHTGGEKPGERLCTLTLLSSVSLQIIPVTAAAIRHSLGAQNPYDIIVGVWVSSAVGLAVGLLTLKLTEKGGGKR